MNKSQVHHACIYLPPQSPIQIIMSKNTAGSSITPYIWLGALGFLGLGAIIAQGVLTNDMIQKYGKNKSLDQALAVIVIILMILVLIAAFGAFFFETKIKKQ